MPDTSERQLWQTLLVALALVVALAGAVLAAQHRAPPAGASAPLAPATHWIRITVDAAGDVGRYLSLALQPGTGTPYVSYYDLTNTDLKWAHAVPSGGNCGVDADAGKWQCDTLSNPSVIGEYTSLAFSVDGSRAGIAYSSSVYNYFHDLMPGNSGAGGQVDTTDSQYNSLKYALITPTIAYQRDPGSSLPRELRLARYVGSGGNCGAGGFAWQCDTIEATLSGAIPALDLDIFFTPRIAYISGSSVKFARYLGSGGNCGGAKWQCVVIESGFGVHQHISLFVPKCFLNCGSLTTQMAYIDTTNERLKYAKFVGSGGNCGQGADANKWQCDVIETIGYTSTMGVSLAADPAGNPVIAYFDLDDRSNGTLKVARPQAGGNCGPSNTWQCTTVDSGFRVISQFVVYHHVGQYASVAVNAAGQAWIAYYDSSSDDLLVAYQFIPVTIQVNTIADENGANPGACSLREAVIVANTNAPFGGCPAGNAVDSDIIQLGAFTYGLTAAGAGEDAAMTGDLDVTDDLIIQGVDAQSTIIMGTPGWNDRIFHILNRAKVTLDGVVIRNGATVARGGGINNERGALAIQASLVISNSAGPEGGGIYNGFTSTLTIDNSAIVSNTTVFGGTGGGIHAIGPMTLTNVTVSGNRASTGGGLSVYGFTTINNTTVNNSSGVLGGSTSGIESSVTSSTGVTYTGAIQLRNTVVANITGNNCIKSGAATITSLDNNLSDDTSCSAYFFQASDQNNVNPLLQPLTLNAPGTTPTHALTFGSPAIDRGDNPTCAATDQRGVARPIDGDGVGGAQCDIGAYEAPAPKRLFLPVVIR